jgi:chaperonin GroES
MNLQPLGDRVIVKPLSEEDNKTPSGIYIPDTAKEKPQEGEVVAVGPGEPNEKGENIKPDVEKATKLSIQNMVEQKLKLKVLNILYCLVEIFLPKLVSKRRI